MENISHLIKSAIQECREDQEGLWSIIDSVKHSGITSKPDEVRSIVFNIIRALLKEKDIVATNYFDKQYHVWNLTPEEAITKIDQEWKTLDHEPTFGDVVIFTSSKNIH